MVWWKPKSTPTADDDKTRAHIDQQIANKNKKSFGSKAIEASHDLLASAKHAVASTGRFAGTVIATGETYSEHTADILGKDVAKLVSTASSGASMVAHTASSGASMVANGATTVADYVADTGKAAVGRVYDDSFGLVASETRKMTYFVGLGLLFMLANSNIGQVASGIGSGITAAALF